MKAQTARTNSTGSYSREFQVSAGPESVYDAITKKIDKWWTVLSNQASEAGETLTIRFERTSRVDLYLREAVPNQILTWDVSQSYMDLEFLTKKDEWAGTSMYWKIEPSGKGSKISFRHEGLVPAFECFEVCQNGWDYFLDSLKDFLNGGQGKPYSGESS